MGILKPVLILVMLSSALVCSNAWGTTPPPRVGALPDPATPAATPAAKPAAVPAKKPVKRRAVRQILDDDPLVYGPRLRSSVGVQPLPSPVPTPPGVQSVPYPVAPAPQVLNGCAGGACTDASGARYQGGVGTTLLSPQGRLCNDNGITVQCF
jgi:hypothetical protein